MTEVAEEEVYEVLANQQRRRIISILHDASASLALADIAIELAEREELEGEEMWERAHQHRIELYHKHLLKLNKTDIVGYVENRAIAWDSAYQLALTLSTAAPSP